MLGYVDLVFFFLSYQIENSTKSKWLIFPCSLSLQPAPAHWMMGVESPLCAPHWLSQGLFSVKKEGALAPLTSACVCQGPHIFRKRAHPLSPGLLPVTKETAGVFASSVSRGGILTFHKKEACLPPYVLAPKSERRVTSSRQEFSKELKLRLPPSGATLAIHTGGEWGLGCICWTPWFCLTHWHACFQGKEH